MKRLPLSLILLTLLIPVKAQEFIGLPEKKIRELMVLENPELNPDNSVRNSLFRYLKYHSADDNETWLIFLDEKGRCYGVRITYGISGYDERIKEMNVKYSPDGLNAWSYGSGRNEVTVRVKKEAWFFTVTHERTDHL